MKHISAMFPLCVEIHHRFAWFPTRMDSGVWCLWKYYYVEEKYYKINNETRSRHLQFFSEKEWFLKKLSNDKI
jgi:hypothetical protein